MMHCNLYYYHCRQYYHKIQEEYSSARNCWLAYQYKDQVKLNSFKKWWL